MQHRPAPPYWPHAGSTPPLPTVCLSSWVTTLKRWLSVSSQAQTEQMSCSKYSRWWCQTHSPLSSATSSSKSSWSTAARCTVVKVVLVSLRSIGYCKSLWSRMMGPSSLSLIVELIGLERKVLQLVSIVCDAVINGYNWKGLYLEPHTFFYKVPYWFPAYLRPAWGKPFFLVRTVNVHVWFGGYRCK